MQLDTYLDLRRADDASVMLDRVVEGPRAWTRETVSAADWTVPLSPAALAELEALGAALRCDPLPTLRLAPEQFAIPAAAAAMARVREVLDRGPGVALVDRLPLDRLSPEDAIAAYWILSRLIARPVAQKWDGTMIYDVTDTGRSFGYGVRGSWTNVELSFHTDNAFGAAPPDYVGLLCLAPAISGGVSRFCSLYTVHNRMLQRHPELLRRLYQPFYYDRQAEHAEGEPRVSLVPAFRYDGRRLRARLSVNLVRKGYELAGVRMDAAAVEAFAALGEILADESLWIEFTIARGQLQYLDNREFAHFRSQFEDHADPARRRRLVRLWLREGGRPTYDG